MLSNLDKQKYSGELLGNLNGLQCGGDFCDVELVAARDSKRISAHRVILSAASVYFKIMFTTQMIESKRFDITIDEVDGDVLLALVKYCYTAEIDINGDNVQNLIEAASFMQLTHVVDRCSAFMELNLDRKNCLGVANIAQMLGCDFLQRRAEEFIAENFERLIESRDFLNLSYERLAALIVRDDLLVTTEGDVLMGVVNWIIYNRKRVPIFPRLLEKMRLPLMPYYLIFHFVHPICREYKYEELLEEALAWHKMPDVQNRRPPRPVSPQYLSRKGQNGMLAIFCRGKAYLEYDICIERFCLSSNKWHPFGTIYSRLRDFGIACHNGIIILAGGRKQSQDIYNTVLSFNLSGKRVVPLCPLSSQRFGLGLAVLDDLVYAVGGENNVEVLNCVECYDPVLNVWKALPSMPTARSHMALAVMGGRLYALGGSIGNILLNVVEVYEPHKDAWTKCASMLQRRTKFAVADSHGYLYAVGGVNMLAVNMVERYDPRIDKWTDVLAMSHTPYSIGCHVQMNEIFFVTSKQPTLNNNKMAICVEKYEIGRNKLHHKCERTLKAEDKHMRLVGVVRIP